MDEIKTMDIYVGSCDFYRTKAMVLPTDWLCDFKDYTQLHLVKTMWKKSVTNYPEIGEWECIGELSMGHRCGYEIHIGALSTRFSEDLISEAVSTFISFYKEEEIIWHDIRVYLPVLAEDKKSRNTPMILAYHNLGIMISPRWDEGDDDILMIEKVESQIRCHHYDMGGI